jgi:hypothetical protein
MITQCIEHTFHNASTEAGNGTPLQVGIFKTLTVEIYGSSDNTARTVTFYQKLFNGVLRPLSGIRTDVEASALALTTTGIGEVWQFDITGVNQVVMDLTSITGGSVSVKGRAVT